MVAILRTVNSTAYLLFMLLSDMNPHALNQRDAASAPPTDVAVGQEHDGLDSSPSTENASPNPSLLEKKSPDWSPQSLSKIYLLILAAISLCLGISCFALVAYSHIHSGLSAAGSSGGFEFYQRFLPTFMAVLYTLLWTPVVVDVVRTEPWALMALHNGSMTEDSILQKDKMWWDHIATAIRNRKRPGGTRWPLLLAVIASLLSSVVINPLSAGLFDTVRILVTTPGRFSGIDASTSSPQFPRISDVIYLRAVTNMLYNVSTSAWNTDTFSVTPFWPVSLPEAPISASLAPSQQLWKGERDVVVAQTECQPFTSIRNTTDMWENLPGFIDLPYLETDDGCGVIFNYGEGQNLTPSSGSAWGFITNSTSFRTLKQCKSRGYREYFVLFSNSSSSGLFNRGKSFSGQVCKSSYMTAKVPVKVPTVSTGAEISFDREAFDRNKRPIEMHYLNTSRFESDFISQTGSTHLRPQNRLSFGSYGKQQNDDFKGPSLVLAANTGYNIQKLMEMGSARIAERVSIVKQRFLGEVLLSGFDGMAQAENTTEFTGEIIEYRSKLSVDLGIGITMGIIFVILAVGSASLSYLVSLSQRPLHLRSDPSKASTAASLINDRASSSVFKGLDKAGPANLETTLKNHRLLVRDGGLRFIHESQDRSRPGSPRRNFRIATLKWFPWVEGSKTKTGRDWRPFSLKWTSGLLLALLLLCITAALVTIYCITKKRPLYESAFVYESDVKLGKVNLTTIAPYSIIPTLLAVAIKLWWGIIDSEHRRLAPLLRMARSPTPKASDAASLSYLSTPIVWITFKAVRKGSWLLAMITLGSVLSEVLQISMAALWAREPGVLEVNMDLVSHLELRSIPHVFPDSEAVTRITTNIAYPHVAKHLYGGEQYQTSWVYGSLAELAFGAEAPGWSKNGWSIPPIDVSRISKAIPNIPARNGSNSIGAVGGQYLNVTFETTGLRGRIECAPILETEDWIVEISNFTHISPFNSSSNIGRRNISRGFAFSPEVRIVNFTGSYESQSATVVVGQWLHANYSSVEARGKPLIDPDRAQNFTVLWANASYPYHFKRNLPVFRQDFIQPVLIFAERPQIQALTCQPIFEAARMRVVVNLQDGKLHNFTLLEPAKSVEDAWSTKFTRHFSNETGYYEPIVNEERIDFNQQRDKEFRGMNAIVEYNTTASWGYLFQVALLQACNVQGLYTEARDSYTEVTPGATPFSFIESDLYSDPYSYASLALVNYNRSALLNATILTSVTQRVFSTFFQWFASIKSGYTDDYWAYQPIGAALPKDMDFGPTESLLISTSTGSRFVTLCVENYRHYTSGHIASSGELSRFSTCVEPTLTSSSYWTTTISTWRIDHTKTLDSSVTGLQATSTTRAQSTAPNVSDTISPGTLMTTGVSATPKTTAPARLRRQDPSTNFSTIKATVSIQTETLKVSPTALFLSVTILLILAVSTLIAYTLQRKQLRLLPRGFDSPASLLATVYASDKLKAWAQRNDEAQVAQKNDINRKKNRSLNADGRAKISMGYFTGADGEEHWGIEVQEDYPLLMETEQNHAESNTEGTNKGDTTSE